LKYRLTQAKVKNSDLKVKARKFWGSVSQRTTLLFLAMAVVAVCALIWMGLRLIQQDRVLESQQLEEKREMAADRAVASLEQLLTNEERKLTQQGLEDLSPSTDDFIKVYWNRGEINTWPENHLLYYPFVPPGKETSSQLFQDAERAEFQDKDYNRAINLLGAFTRYKDSGVQAAAKLRLARNLIKAERYDEALTAYDELGRETAQSAHTVSGVPIELIARNARCALLSYREDFDRLQHEAKGLYQDLQGRRWRLDRSSYIYYVQQVTEWFDSEPESDLKSAAMAEAIAWLWDRIQGDGKVNPNETRRELLLVHEQSITIIWQGSNDRITAIVAGPHYQQVQWFDPLFKSDDFSSVSVSLHASNGSLVYGEGTAEAVPLSSRSSLITGLPWDLSLSNADLESELGQFAQRRRLMFAGLGILALLVIAVSFLISRAVSRELAAARLQADFVSAVSHEFRTPLTSMRQFTEMLLENETIPEEKRRTFHLAQARATNRLSRLVESLLDFGRMEAGARPYRLERADARQLTKVIVDEYQKEVISEASRLEYVAPEGPIQINADRDALGQAVWNLIDNAVKYSEDGKKVRVEVESDKQVIISVKDFGYGIPASELSIILNKFTRGSSAKEHGIKGTGIGLAMVKHIVDAHGGKLEIESELGKGSTFTIVLPAGG
jgi:signal transduction histidine kinase